MKIEKYNFKNEGPIICLAYNLKHHLLAVSQMADEKRNPTVFLFDFENNKVKLVLEAGSFNVSAICFDYTQENLLYSVDEKLFQYNLLTNKKTQLPIHIGRIYKIVSSNTQNLIIVGEKTVVINIDSLSVLWKLIDFKIGEKLKVDPTFSFPEEWNLNITGVPFEYVTEPPVAGFYKDGQTIILGGHNQTHIELWDINSNQIVKTISGGPLAANCLSLGCNELIVAVSSLIPYANFIWEIKSGNRILPGLFNVQFGGYSSLCLHPSELLIAGGSLIGYVTLQDLSEGRFIFSEKLHSNRVSQLILTESGMIFSGSDDGEINWIISK